jgi:hypothetical protein
MPSKKQIIKTYLTDAEFVQIREFAERAGLSLSTFTKKVCLGCQVKSLEHAHVRHELRLLRGDLGKVGGLFKQLLAAERFNQHVVYRNLADLDALKRKIDAALERCT